MKRLLLLLVAMLCTGLLLAGCTDKEYDAFPPLPTVSMDVVQEETA